MRMVPGMDPSRNDSTAADALRTANRVRAELSVQVAFGDLNVDDVVGMALDGGTQHPARQLKLRELLDAKDALLSDEEQRRGNRVNAQFLRLVGRLLDIQAVGQQTVGWLVDGRAGGRRLAAWRDAEMSREVPPGFPWRPLYERHR